MKFFCVLLVVSWFVASPTVLAEPVKSSPLYSNQQHSKLKKNTQSKKSYVVKSSKQAAQMVKGRYGGKVLSTKQSGKSGYKVKLLKNDGRIISVFVNAKTGKF